MTQPPDDRRPMPSEPGEPASSEPPTVAWQPPTSAVPAQPGETPHPDPAPVDTSFAGASGPPVGWPDGGGAPAAVPASGFESPPVAPVPPTAPAAEPRNPLLSATPSAPVGWVTTPDPAVAEVAPGLRFSGTTARFVALVIDWFIVALVATVLMSIAGLRAGMVTSVTEGFIQGVVTTAVSGCYFIALWSGGRRATLGQRLLSIQVGHAFDGVPLTLDQAVRRWLGLGFFLNLFAFTPSLSALSGLAQIVWVFALFVTTIGSPTKQGLHDRFAESAVVRPVSAGNGLVVGCLLLLLLLLVLPVVVIIWAISMGDDLGRILLEIERNSR